MFTLGFPVGLAGKKSACSAGDPSLILGWGDPLKKEMATHSSIFAWRIPWTEESDRLQSMGSQRIRHDLVTNTLFSLYIIAITPEVRKLCEDSSRVFFFFPSLHIGMEI